LPRSGRGSFDETQPKRPYRLWHQALHLVPKRTGKPLCGTIRYASPANRDYCIGTAARRIAPGLSAPRQAEPKAFRQGSFAPDVSRAEALQAA